MIAIALFDSQFISQVPFGISREIAFICKGFITDLLDLRVLCRVNLESAAVEQGICLCLVVACGNQILQYIICLCIDKVCIEREIFFL